MFKWKTSLNKFFLNMGVFVGIFFICFSQGWSEQKLIAEKPIVIVIPSYNNLAWLENNLKSVLDQNYQNYRILYIDDCSKDGTADAVESFLNNRQANFRQINFDDSLTTTIPETTESFSQLVNQWEEPFLLIRNRYRAGALANLYRAIHSCRNEEIIVTVDGDDWLYDPDALTRLNETYQADVWFTHGCLMEYPWGHVSWSEPIPQEAMISRSYRSFKCPSHLRTFYAWLFKKIKLEDFLYKGRFFPMAWDMAIMFPLAEMSGTRHAYISRVNYVYNMANRINDNKVDPQLQRDLDDWIRHLPPYEELEKADF